MRLEKKVEDQQSIIDTHQTSIDVEIAAKEVVVYEAREWVITELWEFEEYKTKTVGNKAGYEKGVDNIFFNMWSTLPHID